MLLVEAFLSPDRLAISPAAILMKLRWAATGGGSERQFTDALRVCEVQHGDLDESYLDDWAPRLGVGDLLSRLRVEAEPIA